MGRSWFCGTCWCWCKPRGPPLPQVADPPAPLHGPAPHVCVRACSVSPVLFLSYSTPWSFASPLTAGLGRDLNHTQPHQLCRNRWMARAERPKSSGNIFSWWQGHGRDLPLWPAGPVLTLVLSLKVQDCTAWLCWAASPWCKLCCFTRDTAQPALSLGLHLVSMETKENRQQAPSKNNFEQPFQYHLSDCHFGCVTFFLGKSLKYIALFTCSDRGFCTTPSTELEVEMPIRVGSCCFHCGSV